MNFTAVTFSFSRHRQYLLVHWNGQAVGSVWARRLKGTDTVPALRRLTAWQERQKLKQAIARSPPEADTEAAEGGLGTRCRRPTPLQGLIFSKKS